MQNPLEFPSRRSWFLGCQRKPPLLHFAADKPLQLRENSSGGLHPQRRVVRLDIRLQRVIKRHIFTYGKHGAAKLVDVHCGGGNIMRPHPFGDIAPCAETFAAGENLRQPCPGALPKLRKNIVVGPVELAEEREVGGIARCGQAIDSNVRHRSVRENHEPSKMQPRKLSKRKHTVRRVRVAAGNIHCQQQFSQVLDPRGGDGRSDHEMKLRSHRLRNFVIRTATRNESISSCPNTRRRGTFPARSAESHRESNARPSTFQSSPERCSPSDRASFRPYRPWPESQPTRTAKSGSSACRSRRRSSCPAMRSDSPLTRSPANTPCQMR